MTKITLNTADDGTITATADSPAIEAFVLGPANGLGKTPVAVQGSGQVILDDWLCPAVEPKKKPQQNRGRGFGR